MVEMIMLMVFLFFEAVACYRYAVSTKVHMARFSIAIMAYTLCIVVVSYFFGNLLVNMFATSIEQMEEMRIPGFIGTNMLCVSLVILFNKLLDKLLNSTIKEEIP